MRRPMRFTAGTITGPDYPCGEGGERALFTVEGKDERGAKGAKGEPTSADRAYQRAALKAFAEGSAKAHGCGRPPTAKP
ncbi:hypothetical protein ACWGH2_01380 [Streptomyces sp. NPDC054871]